MHASALQKSMVLPQYVLRMRPNERATTKTTPDTADDCYF
jgi:hypothetical protein